MTSYTITAKKRNKSVNVHCVYANNVTTFAVHEAKTAYKVNGKLSEGADLYNQNIIDSYRVQSVKSPDDLSAL
jgi:hypothetical protein